VHARGDLTRRDASPKLVCGHGAYRRALIADEPLHSDMSAHLPHVVNQQINSATASHCLSDCLDGGPTPLLVGLLAKPQLLFRGWPVLKLIKVRDWVVLDLLHIQDHQPKESLRLRADGAMPVLPARYLFQRHAHAFREVGAAQADMLAEEANFFTRKLKMTREDCRFTPTCVGTTVPLNGILPAFCKPVSATFLASDNDPDMTSASCQLLLEDSGTGLISFSPTANPLITVLPERYITNNNFYLRCLIGGINNTGNTGNLVISNLIISYTY